MRYTIANGALMFGNCCCFPDNGTSFYEENVAKWADTNLQQGFGHGHDGVDWFFVYKQAINSLWHWRNQIRYSEDREMSPNSFFVYDIMYNAKLTNVTSHSSNSTSGVVFGC